MAWPLSQDYNEAIQNPAQCFADAELKQSEAVTNALGLPQPCSGNFADVYAVQHGAKKWAVKCFTREIPGLQERYVQISNYLKQVQLPFMVDFAFLQQGMKVRGQWFPVLKMQWVEGFALNTFVRDNLDKPAILQGLCQIWQRLAVRLREANLAHCDLQHGNILLVPGSKAGALGVKLVDYDGMCVPALELLKSIELGHANFQHPERLKEGTYGLQIDRFPHLVIYTALRALSVGGKALWDKYDNGDNLLFKQADFEAPRNSTVFKALIQLNDPEVRQLAQAISIASQKPLAQAPLLEDVVSSTTVGMTPAPAQRTTKVPAGQPAPAPEPMVARAVDDPLGQRSRVVFDWLDEQARRGVQDEAFQQAVGSLEHGLVAATSQEQLQQLAQNVLRFQRGMPDTLVQRYQARQRGLRWSRRGRRFLKITVPAAALLLIVAGVVWWIDHKSHNEQVDLAVTTLQTMLEAGQFAEGLGYIENLEKNDPRTADDSRVLALKPHFLGDQHQEEDRQRAFKQALEKAQQAPLNAAGDGEVQQLETLARLPKERGDYASLIEDRKKRREQQARDVDRQLQSSLDDLRQKVAEVAKLPPDSPQAAKKVSELTDEVRKLADKASADGAGTQARADIATVRKQLDECYGKVREKNLEAILLGDMARALSDKDPFSSYLKAAERYVAQYADSPRAKAFQRLAEEHAAWQLALEWGRLSETLGDKPLSLRVKDVKEANGPLDRCRAFLEKHPQSPDAATVTQYVQSLEAILQRDEMDAKSAVVELRKVFALVYVKDVWFLRMKDGQVFYANEDFEPRYKESAGSFIQFKHMIGFDGQTRQASKKYTSVERYGRARQAMLADHVKHLPENFADKSWEDETVDLLQTIRREPELDPFLRFALLKRVSGCAARGSGPLKLALSSFLDDINKAEVNQTLPWMDPDHKEANKVRPQVKEAVDKLPKIDSVLKRCTEEKQKLETALLQGQRGPVGFLLRDGKDQWQCFALGRLSDGELFMIVSGKDQPATWKSIGEVRRGKTTLSSSNAVALAEGRPVFMVRAHHR